MRTNPAITPGEALRLDCLAQRSISAMNALRISPLIGVR